MSWASKRITKRTEDIAYSLLGIFDINMPLLYGEGKRAFQRLQEEIIRQSDDDSIFALGFNQDWGTRQGALAKSPTCFTYSYNVMRGDARGSHQQSGYHATNRGIAFTYAAALHHYFDSNTLIYLTCKAIETDGEQHITLKFTPGSNRQTQVRMAIVKSERTRGSKIYLSALSFVNEVYLIPSLDREHRPTDIVMDH